MNGKEASKFVGITYRQMRYFVDQIDALTKKETSQGHDHEFGFLDLVFLKLAALMRSDGSRLDEINQAVGTLNYFWKTMPHLTGSGALVKDNKGSWVFFVPTDLLNDGEFFYQNAEGEFTKKTSLTHVPGLYYNVAAIASELADENQLTFEFANSEMESMKGN